MARHRLNLDLKDLSRLALALHGPYGAGKTFLQGDFLVWAKEQNKGPVHFLNIEGEDGFASLASLGLGNAGETVESTADFEAALRDYHAEKTFGLAVDSLPAYYNLLLKSYLGTVRYPDPKQDGERAKMVWGQVSMGLINAVALSRAAAPYVFWVSPYDKSEDAIGGSGTKTITPNLPGKLAQAIAGAFDFVGYLTAQTMGPQQVVRKITFAPSVNVLTRQRISRPITQDIVVPEGRGGWKAIMTALEAALVEPKKT